MTTNPIGLYIHIPFCVQKCKYCDFCSAPQTVFGSIEKYVDVLCEEILSYKNCGISVDSIFFGGGTPSLLDAVNFKKIADSIYGTFNIIDGSEISIEVNPKTLSQNNLNEYLKFGVNRFSIGVQSIHENELKMLGRIHSFEDVKQTVKMLRDSNVSNLSVDLMYGIPGQTLESFDETLNEILKFSPAHISVYGLILEEGTPLMSELNSLIFPSEDEEVDMYYHASNILSEAGYRHYEISNYAMPGKRCKHNLKYWENKEYLGVGLSAHSFLNGKRFSNTDIISDYLSSAYRSRHCNETLDKESMKKEYVIMHLRKDDGFSFSEYENLFGEKFTNGRETLLSELSNRGYIVISDDVISLTRSGFYISNWILTELL